MNGMSGEGLCVCVGTGVGVPQETLIIQQTILFFFKSLISHNSHTSIVYGTEEFQ